MYDTLRLLWPRWRSFRNMGTRREEKVKAYFLLTVGTAFWLGVFFATYYVMSYIKNTEMDVLPGVELIGDVINKVLLSMAFLTFLSILIFSNIVTTLSTFFIADDLQLVNSLPVSRDATFYARYVETMVDSSWMILLFGLPVFFGYGAVTAARWSYYVSMPAVIIPFLLIPAAVGVVMTLLLVNAFPARRIRDVLLLLTVVAAGMLILLMRLLQPEQLVNPDSQKSVFEFILTLKSPMKSWLPSFWATEALYFMARGLWRESGQFLLMLWSTGLSLMVITSWLARVLYQETFSKAQESTRVVISRSAPVNRMLSFLSAPFQPATRQVILKDIKVFMRDTSQWSQVFLLAALVIIYIFNFRVLHLERLPLAKFYLQNAISYMNMGLAGFVLAALAARFVFPMVSLEGRAFWLVKTSPLSLRGLLWSKFLLSVVPLLVLAELLITVTNHLLHVTEVVWWISTITIFFMTFGIVGLGVGLGAMYPRFNIDNPAKIATGFGGVIYMIVAMTFIGIIVFLEAWPTYAIFINRMRREALERAEIFGIGLAVFLTVAIIVMAVWLPMRAGLKRLEEMEI